MAPHLAISKPIPQETRSDRSGTRWETLYDVEYKKPKPGDYDPPKEGGGWFRHPNKVIRNPMPFETDLSLYSVEYSRVKVPEKYDHSVLPMDKNDPYIKYRDGFEARTAFQTSSNDMSFHHNKIPIGGFDRNKEILAAEDYGQRKEKELRERCVQEVMPPRLNCGHTEHLKPLSDKECPVKYPYTVFDPANVEHERPLPPIPKEEYIPRKKVTEDDIRNEVRYGPRGTKGFFTAGEGGSMSGTGAKAAEMYYRDVRPFEGTTEAMNACSSIKSGFTYKYFPEGRRYTMR